MTTIAWDGKTLAVDSLVERRGSIAFYESKLLIDKEKGAVACVGDRQDAKAFGQWFLSDFKGDPPKINQDYFTGIFLDLKGVLMYYETRLFGYPISNYPTAWGAGWEWAQAALDHGKDAVEAIEYAITRDPFTGGEVNSFTPEF